MQWLQGALTEVVTVDVPLIVVVHAVVELLAVVPTLPLPMQCNNNRVSLATNVASRGILLPVVPLIAVALLVVLAIYLGSPGSAHVQHLQLADMLLLPRRGSLVAPPVHVATPDRPHVMPWYVWLARWPSSRL